MDASAMAGSSLVGRLLKKKKRGSGLISRSDIRFLNKELISIRAALAMVGEVPRQDRSPHLKVWACELREVAYDTEDVLDTFLVRMEGHEPPDPSRSRSGLLKKMASPFEKTKDRRSVAAAITNIKRSILGIAKRRDGYSFGDMVPVSSAATIMPVDPRLPAVYRSNVELVGIEGPRDDLIWMLTNGADGVSKRKLKAVSIVGMAGLGKTTLAYSVYRELKSQFDCSAFVPVSASPNLKNVFKNILRELDNEKYKDMDEASWDQKKLVDELRQFLQNKRYIIVLDDIWDGTSWEIIRHAMVDSDCGSRLFTTTRISQVAARASYVYQMPPLSHYDSRILFYRMVLGGEGECLDNQLDEVTDKILKNCGGLPLAIVSIAPLLVGKQQTEDWLKVYNSLNSNSTYHHYMSSILYLSYHDLPSNLRNCFLYISVFPEDYKFRIDRLVWLWIAEGFVQEKQGSSLFGVGQSYITELLNRNMIEAVEMDDDDGTVNYFRVHDMVLDLVRFLSYEESVVTVLDDKQEIRTSSEQKVRRISLQHCRPQHTRSAMRMSQVRSVTAFGPGISLMPQLSSFQVLRVMDLEGCDLNGSYDLKHLGDLIHLRYLGLRGTLITVLPKDIGNLRLLQVLDLKGTEVQELPSTVTLLRRLLSLNIEHSIRLPQGMGKLTSMEELSKICISEYTNFVKELASLVELRVLDAVFQEQQVKESLQRDFMESLSKLNKMHTLRISGCHRYTDLDFMSKAETTFLPDLQRFVAVDVWFSALPAWVVSNRINLIELQIGVRELRHEDLMSLGMLRELRILRLEVEHTSERLVVEADHVSFPSLTQLCLRGETCLVIGQGAMPKVRTLEFVQNVGPKANGDFNWGLQNLLSLRRVTAKLRCANASAAEVEKAKAALRRESADLPNRVILEIATIDLPSHQEEQIQSEDGAGKISTLSTSSEIQEECSA